MTVHTEILLIAIAVSIACAIPGVFLVLRRMSMMADAITHTVFLGIVLAFFVTEDLNSPLLLVGATLVGVGTVWLTEMIHNTGLVNEDASIGIIFPLLFSIAIILVSLYSGNAHLDVDTALLGEIAFAPFDRWIVNGTDLGPVSLWISLGVAVINLVLVMLFYKELQLSTFDPLLAGLFGFMPALIHYVLMTMVSLTVVASFQAVGAILVIGLMIGPAVIAYLWTDSVKAMLTSSIIIGMICAVIGTEIAFTLDVSIAGAIATTIGIRFINCRYLHTKDRLYCNLSSPTPLASSLSRNDDALPHLYPYEHTCGGHRKRYRHHSRTLELEARLYTPSRITP